ncbi:MAG: hypothetical protein A2847_02730 [Candidatus Sungbacteria bacterium RIFCSPHIGHO2_01_FULL_50_25]|uniref:Pilus assembly protein PilO n=1 Tax=Candidatus Sungbacteria bacterium RIFCSPHIGHO2_01_FULL_50_25 TaxID=1802265 RepID=A0A1G2KEU4_9BACT|nr:MAG: hypothetical protein A2847_02730 [Candidatus Sungbacteria bacterium RIFCSPHIGHO2_01_FULL_50_25]
MATGILTLILFISAIAGGVFYVWPQGGRYMAVRRDTQALERISKELDSAAEEREKLKQKISSVSEADLGRIEQALPKGTQKETLVRTIEYYGIQNNVAVKLMNFADRGADTSVGGAGSSIPRPAGAPETGDTGEQKQLEISLSVSGNYQNMKRFIDSLERHIRIIDVTGVAFPTIESAAQVFDTSIRGVTYYQ